MNIPIIKLSHVSKYYKTKTGVAEGMRDVSLELFNNEFVAITGESGSGKTTLLNVISGLDSYEDGELYYNGLETSHYTVKDFEKFRAQNIAFVFQNYNVIDSYSVYDNIVIALEAQNYPQKEVKARALELIDKVGLTSHKNQRTAKLSGGEKQRVVIARALAKNAPIILADEPTGNLDEKSGEEILTLLKEISQDRLVILVSHNIAEVNKYATRKIIMEDGNIKNDIIMEKTPITPSYIDDNFAKGNSLKKSFKIALKNIFKTPKRTIFSLVLTSIILFTTMFLYSSLVVNAISEISSISNDNDPSIAIIKRNDQAFNPGDLDEFSSSKKVNIYFDITFKDQVYVVELDREDSFYYISLDLALYSSAANYKLKDGRLPQTNYEVLVRENYYEGEYFAINDVVKFGDKDFTIVGILEYKEKNSPVIYFRDSFIYSEDLKINPEASFLIENDNNFSIIGINAKDYQELKLIKKEIDENKYQIVDRSIIDNQGMKVIIGFLTLFFWAILILVLQVLFLVLYQIQKNMMESKKKDFSVYRSIGINEVEVSFVILFEQLLISLLAAVLVVVTLLLLSLKINFIYNITRNLGILNYLLIILIFMFFSLSLGRRYNKKIFKLTVIEALKEDN